MNDKVAGWPFDSLIEKLFLPKFHKEGEAAFDYLVRGQISKMAFLSAYKKLKPIEEMPENEKKELKRYVTDLFPNKTIPEKLDACKIIYTIGSLL